MTELWTKEGKLEAFFYFVGNSCLNKCNIHYKQEGLYHTYSNSYVTVELIQVIQIILHLSCSQSVLQCHSFYSL